MEMLLIFESVVQKRFHAFLCTFTANGYSQCSDLISPNHQLPVAILSGKVDIDFCNVGSQLRAQMAITFCVI